MRVTAESTTKIVELNGVPARVWHARTESGIECFLFVTRVAVANNEDLREFDQELQKHRAPVAAIDSIPLRLIL